jgi:hypothetical protein
MWRRRSGGGWPERHLKKIFRWMYILAKCLLVGRILPESIPGKGFAMGNLVRRVAPESKEIVGPDNPLARLHRGVGTIPRRRTHASIVLGHRPELLAGGLHAHGVPEQFRLFAGEVPGRSQRARSAHHRNESGCCQFRCRQDFRLDISDCYRCRYSLRSPSDRQWLVE